MTIQWKEIGTAGRIEAIRSVWSPGCSAAQIAKNFEGASRNSIIGAYHRHGRHLLDMPLSARSAVSETGKEKQATPRGTPGRKSKQRPPEPRRATVSFRPEPSQPKPLPTPRDHAHEARLCGKPLVMLGAKECKWPVNEAEQGGLHLFCGLPSEGSYCSHHTGRAYQPEKRP